MSGELSRPRERRGRSPCPGRSQAGNRHRRMIRISPCGWVCCEPAHHPADRLFADSIGRAGRLHRTAPLARRLAPPDRHPQLSRDVPRRRVLIPSVQPGRTGPLPTSSGSPAHRTDIPAEFSLRPLNSRAESHCQRGCPLPVDPRHKGAAGLGCLRYVARMIASVLPDS